MEGAESKARKAKKPAEPASSEEEAK
jgi:hypothetical protein